MRRLASSFGLALPLALGAVAGCGAAPQREVARPRRTAVPALAKRPAEAPLAEERAADDGITLQGQLGTLDPDVVDSALGGHKQEVDACFRSGLDRFRYLGGTLEVKVRVNSDGSVKTVAAALPLGSLTVDKCVVGVVRATHFPAPFGHAEAEFNYSWQFRPRAALRQWEASQLAPAFQKNRAELLVCARKSGLPPPPHGAPAGLRVTVFVTPGGHVGSVGVGGDAPLDEPYASCVATRVAAWRFADPLGAVAHATYQFGP